MPVDRITRVNEILKREIADLLEKREYFIDNCLVSVTSVRTSSTLREAKVSISVMGGGEDAKKQIIKYLERERSELQRRISRDVVLKYTPVLHFAIDRNIEEGDKVLSLIQKMEDEENSAK